MKHNILLVLLSFFTLGAFSQSGTVFETLTLNSKILKSERKFAIYLPPDYETSERKYPVLYLLHGMGDDQTGWIQFGEMNTITDNAINEGKATPMIIVMPDANTERQGYFNDVAGDFDYERFFFDEFMPHIEKTYRTRNEKQFRAIAGLSMGGGGTLVYALHRPELFSAACPLSAAIRVTTIDFLRERYSKKGKINDDKLSSWHANYDILEIVDKLPEYGKLSDEKKIHFYIDCGDDDFLYEGNALLHIALRKKGYPHEYRVRDGGHTWGYWRASLPEVLTFITKVFHR